MKVNSTCAVLVKKDSEEDKESKPVMLKGLAPVDS